MSVLPIRAQPMRSSSRLRRRGAQAYSAMTAEDLDHVRDRSSLASENGALLRLRMTGRTREDLRAESELVKFDNPEAKSSLVEAAIEIEGNV